MEWEVRQLRPICDELEGLTGHRFDVITSIEPGIPSPIEALSEDHMMGVYFEVMPRKMREKQSFFERACVDEFLPATIEKTGIGPVLYLEIERLRGCRFRAGDLQYLAADFEAYVDDVKYPAKEVLGALHYMKTRFGGAHLYVNTMMPMPLWIRSAPLGASQGIDAPQIVIQATSNGAPIPTNIHTDITMDFASKWFDAVRGYYKILG